MTEKTVRGIMTACGTLASVFQRISYCFKYRSEDDYAIVDSDLAAKAWQACNQSENDCHQCENSTSHSYITDCFGHVALWRST
jgi:hypothetical protein